MCKGFCSATGRLWLKGRRIREEQNCRVSFSVTFPRPLWKEAFLPRAAGRVCSQSPGTMLCSLLFSRAESKALGHHPCHREDSALSDEKASAPAATPSTCLASVAGEWVVWGAAPSAAQPGFGCVTEQGAEEQIKSAASQKK